MRFKKRFKASSSAGAKVEIVKLIAETAHTFQTMYLDYKMYKESLSKLDEMDLRISILEASQKCTKEE